MWFKRKKSKAIDVDNAIGESFKNIQEKALTETIALKETIIRLQLDIRQKQEKIDEMLPKLREQNEADIFLECERIKKKILDGEKRESLHPNLSQLAMMQNVAQQFGGYQGDLGGLGRLFDSRGRYQ